MVFGPRLDLGTLAVVVVLVDYAYCVVRKPAAGRNHNDIDRGRLREPYPRERRVDDVRIDGLRKPVLARDDDVLPLCPAKGIDVNPFNR